MKKVLCGMICVAAGASFASITNTVATVDVIAIDSRLTNTVIAVPGLDLATGGDLAISNLVKTTNLTEGDRLLAFDGSKYDGWTLSSDKTWVRPLQKFSLNAVGEAVVDNIQDASLVTKAVGSGIWLSRQDVSVPIYIYAQHTNTLSSTVAAGTTALLGNPSSTSKAPTVSGCANNDKLYVPTNKFAPETYIYKSTKWYRISGISQIEASPTITAGTGFWYVSTGSADVTVSWE